MLPNVLFEVGAVVSRNNGKLLIKSAFGEKETSNLNAAPISVLPFFFRPMKIIMMSQTEHKTGLCAVQVLCANAA